MASTIPFIERDGNEVPTAENFFNYKTPDEVMESLTPLEHEIIERFKDELEKRFVFSWL